MTPPYDENRVRRITGGASTPSSRPQGMSPADYVDFLVGQRDAARRKNGLRKPPSQSLPPVPAPRVPLPNMSGASAQAGRPVVARARQMTGDAAPIAVPGQRGGPASAGPPSNPGARAPVPVEVLNPGTPRLTGSPPVGPNRYNRAGAGFGMRQFPGYQAGGRVIAPARTPMSGVHPVTEPPPKPSLPLPVDPVQRSVVRAKREGASFDKLDAPRRQGMAAKRKYGG